MKAIAEDGANDDIGTGQDGDLVYRDISDVMLAEVDSTNDDEVNDSGMEAGMESEEEEGQDGDPDSDLIVLDPDHPLMTRFQRAYKEYLMKQDEKFTLELRELEEEHNNSKKQREEIGVELYGVQQELARQQMLLEQHHDKYNEEEQKRKQHEGGLLEVRTLYKQIMSDLQQQQKKTSDLQNEVESIAASLQYMESAKDDVRSDIAIIKRAAEKAETEVSAAQQDKKRQDMMVNKLVHGVDRLEGDIAMFEAQIDAQREETKATMKTLTEASIELEAIELEKKLLLQQWNNSLIGMKRRDEAYAVLQDTLSMLNQQQMAIETELGGYKRQIQKAQEQNEQLTYMHNRIEGDIAQVKRQTTISQNKQETLRIEYSTYSRALNETEQALSKVQTEVTLKENELVSIRKSIERHYQDKVKLEDEITGKMQEQLTVDKASEFMKKTILRLKKKAHLADRSTADVENEISRDILEIANSTTRVKSLQDVLKDINNVIQQKNETISKIENEIVKRNAVIEKKQGTIDVFSKKIDALINKEGDELYVGPLEFQIKTLQRQIKSKSSECLELQQYWLRQQNELVKVLQDVQDQTTEIDSKKKQSTILLQKKLRIEGEIDSQKNEMKDIARNVRSMQNDMTKLNVLIHKNRDMQEVLEQDNILMENDFMATLKDAELESIQMQNSITGLGEEKERLLNALVEAERQIMLWEKKTQLAREARDAVDSDVGQGEIKAMKAEIHRMEVRYTQLMRQQEKMIQDMEKSVFKRESIIVRGDAQAKMQRKKLGKPKLDKGAFHKKMNDLRRKIKQTNVDADSYEEEIKRERDLQHELSAALEEKQLNVKKLQQAVDIGDSDVALMTDVKARNLSVIVTKQQRGKHYTSLKAGKYNRLCKSADILETEKQKHIGVFQGLSTLVDRMNNEYPEIQECIRNISILIGNNEQYTERSSVKDLVIE